MMKLVAHSIVHFANDSDSEVVLSFMRFKDGQIISMETGATPLSDDYQLIDPKLSDYFQFNCDWGR